MNNQFDERLSDKIRDVFDNYDDNLAEDGWKELRKKYPAKTERSPFIYWISSAAAAIVLALGVWVLLPSGNEQGNENIAKLNQTEKQKKIPAPGETTVAASRKVEPAAQAETFAARVKPAEEDETGQSLPETSKAGKNKLKTIRASAKYGNTGKEKTIIASIGEDQSQKLKSNNSDDHTEKSSTDFIIVSTELRSQSLNTEASPKTNNTGPVASSVIAKTEKPAAVISETEMQGEIPAPATAKTPASESATTKVDAGPKLEQVPKSVSPLVLAGADTGPEKSSFLKIEEDKPSQVIARNEQKVTFGVYAGSFVNYAEGSNNKLNLGAGFSSDIALTRNLKLSTGVGISKNDLSFDSGNFPKTPFLSASNAFDKNSEIAHGMLKDTPYYNLNAYSASLLGVDIPTNLKLVLPKRKDELFVSAGVSSGAFLNEKYNYQYQNVNPLATLSADVQQKTDEKKQNGFGNFEFARTLNFSVGVGYPLGKQNRLVIEPFLRYPLKDMGQENLRFGAGGVNLKLNFQPNKK